METVRCNLCGSADNRLAYRMPDARYFPDEVFDVVECTGCGLGFVNPRPTFAEMSRFYPAEFYDFFERDRRSQERRYRVESSFLRDVELTTTTPRLLDIGCANGDFPRYMMSRGWDVEGVEVSETSRPIADFPVYTTAFPSIPIGEPVFDAITAWAVLEHVHDPMGYFQKAGRLLKPGGRFAFLVTNFESVASRHLFCEDVPRHLYFFTKETVRRYLELAGLRMLRVEYSDRIYPMLPINWLRFRLHGVLGKPYTFQDVPMNRTQFLQSHGMSTTLGASAYWALANPLTAIDRLAAPIVSRVQKLTRRYGIATYVATTA